VSNEERGGRLWLCYYVTEKRSNEKRRKEKRICVLFVYRMDRDAIGGKHDI